MPPCGKTVVELKVDVQQCDPGARASSENRSQPCRERLKAAAALLTSRVTAAQLNVPLNYSKGLTDVHPFARLLLRYWYINWYNLKNFQLLV